jgi:hypothetical protein
MRLHLTATRDFRSVARWNFGMIFALHLPPSAAVGEAQGST